MLLDTAAEYIGSLVMAIPGLELAKLVGFCGRCFGDGVVAIFVKTVVLLGDLAEHIVSLLGVIVAMLKLF
eukprot:7931231-Alexandrium_andersonii.AAC.1